MRIVGFWSAATVLGCCQLGQAFFVRQQRVRPQSLPCRRGGFKAEGSSRQARWPCRPVMAAARQDGSPPADVTVAVAGATGYIGRAVVRECVRRGYKTLALARGGQSTDRARSMQELKGAELVETELSSAPEICENVFQKANVDVIISCIASRSGVPDDSWRVDYQANVNLLDAALAANSRPKHFVMLSAFCVRQPELVFQHAKLKFEDYLRSKADTLLYTIVRPTAFFKSVSGQLEIVQKGYPYVMFGDGEVCKCNPIAESDLATYIVNSVSEPAKHNQVLDIGGPDDGLTPKQQAELLFEAVRKDPSYISVPVGLFDAIIGVLDFAAKFFSQARDATELARIGKYYAVNDMLTENPNERFGRITLKDHFQRIAKEGQEYDPFTTMFASAPVQKAADKA